MYGTTSAHQLYHTHEKKDFTYQSFFVELHSAGLIFMTGRFEIYKDRARKFRFRLVVANGETYAILAV